MKKMLSVIRIISLVLWILIFVHILAEWILGQIFNFLFHEMYYIPILAFFMGLLCFLDAKNSSAPHLQRYNYVGTAIWSILLVTSTAFMIADPCGYKGNIDFFCRWCGQEVVSYFMPIFALAGVLQQIIRLRKSKTSLEKFARGLSLSIMILYLFHSLILITDGIIRHGTINLLYFNSQAILYVPAFLCVNIVFWLAKQAKDTIVQ